MTRKKTAAALMVLGVGVAMLFVAQGGAPPWVRAMRERMVERFWGTPGSVPAVDILAWDESAAQAHSGEVTDSASAAPTAPAQSSGHAAPQTLHRSGATESNLEALLDGFAVVARRIAPQSGHRRTARAADSRDADYSGPTAELAVSGRITDTSGNPIANADVGVRNFIAWPVTTTGDDGTYELKASVALENNPQARYLLPFVTIVADGGRSGHGTAKVEQVPLIAANVDLSLELMGTVEGVVVDATTKQPVTDFEVRIGHFWRGEQYTALPIDMGWEHVDAPGGRFSLSTQGYAKFRVEARAAYYVLGRSDVVLAQDSLTSGVVVELRHGDDITGVVLDSQTQQPLENARVRCLEGQLWNHNMLSDHDYITGADGRFVLPGEQGSTRTTVLAWHTDYSPGFAPNLDESQRQNVVIHLAKGGTLEGTVKQGGKPLPGISVIPKQTLAYPEPAFVDGTRSSASGNYHIDGLPPGIFSVRFLAPNGMTYGKALAEIASGQVTRLDVDLGEFARIVGMVAGVDRIDDIEFFLADVEMPGEILYNAAIQANGYFEFGMVRPGEYIVEAVKEGPPRKVFSQVCAVTPGQILDITVDFSEVPEDEASTP